MIKNHRQYKLTQAHAKSFSEALTRLCDEGCPHGVDPVLNRAELDGMASQLETLNREISEYELLSKGNVASLTLKSLAELPQGLIKARIARGLTQKQLAALIDVKPQQIQRWESEDYEGAGFQRLVDIAKALQLSISEHIELPTKPKDAFTALKQFGIEKAFIFARLAANDSKYWDGRRSDVELLCSSAARLKKIYGIRISTDGVITSENFTRAASGAGRFKIPLNADEGKVNAYAAYAYHLAKIVAQAASHKQKSAIPTTWTTLKAALCGDTAPTFEGLLRGAWALGIAVLPLADPIHFHGVCWRIKGRNVVVLKQPTQYSSRWAFDLLHEIYHAGETPESDSLDCVELNATDVTRRESEDELSANRMAGDILLHGRADELYQAVLTLAKRKVERLKSAVQRVAEEEGVSAAHLANYVAFRVKSDLFIQWWGAANNLQPPAENPLELARQVLNENIEAWRLESDDRDLLQQALRDPSLH
jgi:transcriptional regulator with XRE-family HTH domain